MAKPTVTSPFFQSPPGSFLYKTFFSLTLLMVLTLPNSGFTQCTIPNPPIVATAPFWHNFDVDGNPVSSEFGILHYFTGSKIMVYSSLVNVHLVGGELGNIANGVVFDGTEDFSGSGEFTELATGDWQIVFKYIPDGRLGFLNFTVTNDGIESSPDSIEVTRYGLQDPTDSDGIVAGDCASLSNTALPIELDFFRVTALEDEIELKWSTLSEIDNLGFDVQRSLDGKNFQSIGWRAGQGYSNFKTNYYFLDEEVQKNITYYYRLVNRDQLGGGQTSPLESARVKGDRFADVSDLFPNPVFGNYTNVQIVGQKDSEVAMTVFNSQGKLVQAQSWKVDKGLNNYQVEVEAFPSGQYILLVQGEIETSRRKFIIAR